MSSPEKKSPTPPQTSASSIVWPLALAATIIWASGNSSAPQVPSFFPFSFDKLAHFCIFGLLASLIIRTPWIWRLEKKRAWLTIVIVSLFGMSDELHQATNPVRFFQIEDWIADTTGAMLAVFVYTRWHFYRHLMEIRIFGRKNKAA